MLPGRWLCVYKTHSRASVTSRAPPPGKQVYYNHVMEDATVTKMHLLLCPIILAPASPATPPFPHFDTELQQHMGAKKNFMTVLINVKA